MGHLVLAITIANLAFSPRRHCAEATAATATVAAIAAIQHMDGDRQDEDGAECHHAPQDQKGHGKRMRGTMDRLPSALWWWRRFCKIDGRQDASTIATWHAEEIFGHRLG